MKNTSKKPSRKTSERKIYKYLLFSLTVITFLTIITVVFVCFLFEWKSDSSEIKDITISEEAISDDTPAKEEKPNISELEREPAEKEKPDVPEPEDVSTEIPKKPQYDFTIEEVYVKLEGLKHEYTVAWVSDLHMINKETDLNNGGISPGSLLTLRKRYKSFSLTDGNETIYSEDLWPEIVNYLNYEKKFDAIIFGGDMMDYCSKANMETLKKGYTSLQEHYGNNNILYIRADHDYGAWHVGNNFSQLDIYDLHEELDGDSLEKKYLDFGEFVMIGINDSTHNISEEYFSIIQKQYEKAAMQNKPIIAVTHVPYGSNVNDTININPYTKDGMNIGVSLKELSFDVRNKEYYWSGPDYQPSKTTNNYLNTMIFSSTEPLASQVLAGHLHAPWHGMITEQVPEHIFSPAFKGVIGMVHIVPTDKDVDTTKYTSTKLSEMYPEDWLEKSVSENQAQP